MKKSFSQNQSTDLKVLNFIDKASEYTFKAFAPAFITYFTAHLFGAVGVSIFLTVYVIFSSLVIFKK